MMMIDIRTCSAQALASALIENHGNDAAVEILLQATKFAQEKQEPQTKKSTASALLAEAPGKDGSVAENMGDPVLIKPIEASFLSPRLGKCELQLYSNGFLVASKLNDSQIQVIVPATCMSHIVVFPKPEDCKVLKHQQHQMNNKKLSGALVLVRLSNPMEIQNKPVQQLCFPLPSQKNIGPIGPNVNDNNAVAKDVSSDDPTGEWCQLLENFLVGKNVTLARIEPGKSSAFRSFQPPDQSTTTGGMPFINCYQGVNDGVLYPLKEGLLFFKPPKFLPRSELYSIACGRGSGGGQTSSRYVDMVVQVLAKDDKGDEKKTKTNSGHIETVEFSNIQREENSVLNNYIHTVLVPAMTEDAEKASNEEGGGNDDDSAAEVIAEAIVEGDDDEETEDEEELQYDKPKDEGGHCDEDSNDDDFDDDDDDEDFDDEEHEDDDDDGKIFGDEDENDGFEIVRDGK
jgi:hypothetical protein